jgi:hypothetical protein
MNTRKFKSLCPKVEEDLKKVDSKKNKVIYGTQIDMPYELWLSFLKNETTLLNETNRA